LVVVEVPADAGKVVLDLNAGGFEDVPRPDARSLQNLGGMERAGRHDDFLFSADLVRLGGHVSVAGRKLDADGLPTFGAVFLVDLVEEELGDAVAGKKVKVGSGVGASLVGVVAEAGVGARASDRVDGVGEPVHANGVSCGMLYGELDPFHGFEGIPHELLEMMLTANLYSYD